MRANADEKAGEQTRDKPCAAHTAGEPSAIWARAQKTGVALSLLALAISGLARPATAQDRSSTRTVDVASIDAIIGAFYTTLSGAAGQPRDWNRLRALFVPGARLFGAYVRSGGGAKVVTWSVEQYIGSIGPMLTATGFQEREIGRRNDAFGNMAHVSSAFVSRRNVHGRTVVERGLHSFELLKDGTRWWIVSVYGDTERPGNPLPAAYLTADSAR